MHAHSSAIYSLGSVPAVPATTNLQTASGGRFLGATGCEAAEMPGTVTVTVPLGGMIVGALTTDGVASTPGAAALLIVVVRDPDGAPAGAVAGAAAAPTVVPPVIVPDEPTGVLAAAFAKAAAVAAAAAAAPGRADPLDGAVAGLASGAQRAGAAARSSSRQVTAAHGRDAMVIMRLTRAPTAVGDRRAAALEQSKKVSSPAAKVPAAGHCADVKRKPRGPSIDPGHGGRGRATLRYLPNLA